MIKHQSIIVVYMSHNFERYLFDFEQKSLYIDLYIISQAIRNLWIWFITFILNSVPPFFLTESTFVSDTRVNKKKKIINFAILAKYCKKDASVYRYLKYVWHWKLFIIVYNHSHCNSGLCFSSKPQTSQSVVKFSWRNSGLPPDPVFLKRK